ncbi:threonine synthase [Natrononativus amylolyticus]|uniref:threonine synthase n=1 Tax=Natrononativus amylolyticus TaxID=2963434 RepID=UPI0020CCE0A1|nr:threonine synthase [Natrononativus amylolyticus]
MAARQCYACDRSYDEHRARCDSGEPLWVPLQTTATWPGSDEQTRRGRDPASSGIWRYEPLLPASRPPAGADLAPGATPLLRAAGLEPYAGARLWLKDEGRNPTGSFKDRGSAVGVAEALEAGADRVGTVSHGNMALSTAAHAATAGLECVVLVPDDIADARLRAIGRFDPQIVRVQGDYGRLYHDALALGAEHGIRFLNSDVPLRVAGQKTLAYELVDSSPDLDAVVLPVSSGGNASAVWKGLLEARASGRIDALPRLYLTQAAACDPIAAAFRARADRVEPATDVAETVAYSIANADPPSGTRALAAVRDTGGAIVSVGESAILEAQDRLARTAGVRAEPASATTLAGLRQLTAEGEIGADERVACVLTGRGYGDGGGVPVTERVERTDLEAAIALE